MRLSLAASTCPWQHDAMLIPVPGFAVVLLPERLAADAPPPDAVASGWLRQDGLAVLPVDDARVLEMILAELAAVGLHPDREWPAGRQGAVIANGRLRADCAGIGIEAAEGGVHLMRSVS